MMNGGQRQDSLQIHILGISIPNARCMQNLGSIRSLGAILGLPSHITRPKGLLDPKNHSWINLEMLQITVMMKWEFSRWWSWWEGDQTDHNIQLETLKAFVTLLSSMFTYGDNWWGLITIDLFDYCVNPGHSLWEYECWAWPGTSLELENIRF